jgi:predicted negative regulator of RcsB-dependent stress response
MKNFIANNWFKLAIILVALLTIGGAFYWFQWRPSQIMQRCSAEARFDKRATLEFDEIKRQEFINSYYKDCLTQYGIK